MICGLDEAGRGPLAGPVCAAAVILPKDFPAAILDDSKKLSARRREDARHVICEKAAAWAVAWASHTEIDAINILQASLLAMKRAFESLFDIAPNAGGRGASAWPSTICDEYPFGSPLIPPAIPAGLEVVADGLYTPAIAAPCTAMVKADAAVHEVMAASILAKTARDELMNHYARLYPQYGYDRHKGYPTKEHRALVLKYGPSPVQRKSFRITGLADNFLPGMLPEQACRLDAAPS
ncbi:MAG: ribonuclease HII [Treponema sp.]|jgi:ribonuclease HII|nr:ribonuclease HII [Treponema sp.]